MVAFSAYLNHADSVLRTHAPKPATSSALTTARSCAARGVPADPVDKPESHQLDSQPVEFPLSA